ncbi:ABC transporter permease [Mycoplasmopsis verecunda]|uniref:Oligopeptide transport system permease protein n=1 Tax=Mycoplasmopsis verecunda TaxID=171291 RepID=A0A1T4L776_9BACT|nr:ABC transporter permease [Mycoplasmopsis verecunda]WPB54770.1 ABC transporter permease [Mycoplasmopsis verecunda]SJZ50559.1 oligopeptide transport system permease protein [Mycoplasmopsis verecunda]
MWKYILKRIGFAILTLIIITLVVYLLVAQFAENPFAQKAIQAQQSASGHAGTTAKELRDLYDKSVQYHLIPNNLNYEEVKNTWMNMRLNPFIRFGYWIQELFTNPKNPFGLPFDQNLLQQTNTTSISEYFFKYLKYSIIITLPAFVISAILGITLGIFAGYKRGSVYDAGINFFALFFIALPSFVIAPILISILFSLNIPPQFINFNNKTDVEAYGVGKMIVSWIPPIAIIVLGSLSGYITYTRNQVITVLTSNYILIAKSKGLSKREIFFKYVLRNISIPLAAILIPSYIGLLSGGIVIETYWNVPGTSQVIAQAFPKGEINIIMFSTVFFTALSLFTTIIVDVSFAFLDPRIKYTTSSPYSYTKFIAAWKERNKEFEMNETVAKGGK